LGAIVKRIAVRNDDEERQDQERDRYPQPSQTAILDWCAAVMAPMERTVEPYQSNDDRDDEGDPPIETLVLKNPERIDRTHSQSPKSLKRLSLQRWRGNL